MSPEERLYRDLFLSELWPVCREVSREERAVEKVRRGLGRNALTWEDDRSKTAPGPVVGATGRIRGLTPESDSEAPMNHALSSPCRQQVAN